MSRPNALRAAATPRILTSGLGWPMPDGTCARSRLSVASRLVAGPVPHHSPNRTHPGRACDASCFPCR